MNTLSKAYAIIIGVGNDLPVTVRDAKVVKEILEDKNFAGYLPENILLLTEEEAKRDDILKGFDQIIDSVDEDSSVLIYYSGHGGTYMDNDILFEDEKVPESENNRHFYLLPNNFDPENFDETWVTADELKDKIKQIRSRRLVFFLDCCHAEGMTKAMDMSMVPSSHSTLHKPEAMAQNIEGGRGISIISSCREDQQSYIMEGDGNSLFTKSLVEVLKGQHKEIFTDPFIRITEVTQYLFKRVPEVKPEQRPFVNLQIYDDFVLSCVPQELVQGITEDFHFPSNEKGEMVTTFRKSENANNVILFVHGFTGESSSTFGDIPAFLMEDERFDGWDFYPVGLSENVQPNLGKNVWASENELNILSDFIQVSVENKYGRYDRVAIVSHGIGGIGTQKAILQMDEDNLRRVTHVLLFGSPNMGVKKTALEKLDSNVSFLSEDEHYINSLRKDWDNRFSDEYPFYLKVIAATNDAYIPIASNLQPFPKKNQSIISGDHFTMTKPSNKESDGYAIIVESILNNQFYNLYTSPEEINITLGEYKTVVDKLLPKVDELDLNGIKMLCFALEGLEREEEAIEILNNYTTEEGDLISMLAGRLKRLYLLDYEKKNADESISLYQKSLDLALSRNDIHKIYYNAINLAFLSLVSEGDMVKMAEYNAITQEALSKDPIESMWKLATAGESALYQGDFAGAMEHYERASRLAGIREKISMYTNASIAYQELMNSKSIDDDFMRFLNKTLL